LLGRTEATSKASGAGMGALWAKAEKAARMQRGSLNLNKGMYLCSILLNIIDGRSGTLFSIVQPQC
jgi:hypothetical protein